MSQASPPLQKKSSKPIFTRPRRIELLQRSPLSIVLLSAHSAIYVLASNTHAIRINAAWCFSALKIFSLCLATGLIAYMTFQRLTKRSKSAEVASLIILCALAHYRPIFASVEHLGHRIFLPSLFILVTLLCGVVLIPKWQLGGLCKFLQTFLVALVAILVIQILRTVKMDRVFFRGNSHKQVNSFSGKLPNIYFLIFDSYPSNSVLKNKFQYDNSKFLAELSQMGFHTVPRALSNYSYTLESVAATLSGRYVEHGRDPYDLTFRAEQLERFKKLGYRVVSVSSLAHYPMLTRLSAADQVFHCDYVEPHMRLTLQNSIISPFFRLRNWSGILRKKNLDCVLSKISEKVSRPTLFFVYFYPLHEPQLISANGKIHSRDTLRRHRGSVSGRKFLFLDELQYLNSILTKTLQKLTTRSPSSIILLQGDHAPRVKSHDPIKWRNPTKEFIQQRLGILNTIRMPQSPQEVPSTPINTLPLVYSVVTQQPLELKPDRYFLKRHKRLQEVTHIQVPKLASVAAKLTP